MVWGVNSTLTSLRLPKNQFRTQGRRRVDERSPQTRGAPIGVQEDIQKALREYQEWLKGR
jgi:hypothetical protein